MNKEKGQALVELGVTFVFLMFLLSGAVEFGLAFFQYVQLRDAAQEGAVYGSMFPNDSVSIENRIRYASQSPINLRDPAVEIVIAYPDSSTCEGKAIEVRVTYHHKVFMPFMSFFLGESILLSGRVTNTILNQECNL